MLAFLTVLTTTSTRRSTLFCHGFVVSFSRYMSVSNTRVQKGMELNHSKRPRNEEASPNSGEEYINNNIMMKRSQYERKMGRIISACSTCHGEGKIRGPLSKKARALKMERRSKSDDPRPMIPCRACDGTGLISFLATESTIQHQHQSNNSKVRERLPISVAIVGGGIGGIALAIALQHRNIPCVVYERDISFEERKQGYGLTMQQGARALRSLGFFNLLDENDSNNNEEEEETNDIIDDNNKKFRFGIHSTRHIVHKPCGTVVGEWGMEVWGGRFMKNGRKHAKRQNAHISRQNLRKLLMEMLQPDTIRWGHQLIGYSRPVQSSVDNHYLDLTFQRRGSKYQERSELITTTTSATILVGCDGIRSAVRAKKLGEEVSPLRYLGCIVVLGIVRSPDTHLTDGKTVFQTADGVTRLYVMPFAHPASDDVHIASSEDDEHSQRRGLSMWQLSFPMDEIHAQELSAHGPLALKAEALTRCGLWHDPIPSLLSQTSLELVTGYPCYDRNVLDVTDFRTGCKAQETADSDPFVTLLGDAAHPMSPFKGKS